MHFRLHISRYQTEDYEPNCSKLQQNASRHALWLDNRKTHGDKICVRRSSRIPHHYNTLTEKKIFPHQIWWNSVQRLTSRYLLKDEPGLVNKWHFVTFPHKRRNVIFSLLNVTTRSLKKGTTEPNTHAASSSNNPHSRTSQSLLSELSNIKPSDVRIRLKHTSELSRCLSENNVHLTYKKRVKVPVNYPFVK